ncbi:MAG: beta-glucosidase family protein [Spirochaetota bacterium]
MRKLRFEHLIRQLNLDEKISLLSGKDFWQTRDIPRLQIPSIYLADGPHGIRRQAVAAERMGLNKGIPSTCFPTEATVANSWNVELGEKVGAFLGTEAVSQGVSILLGPGINMKRIPICGRNFEYFSEDPYLAGKMAAAYVRGIQSKGIAACVKHYAVSNQEYMTMSIDAVVDERTLREIYLTAFEIAVKEGGARTLMSAYNKVNGIYANENLHLMRDILRKEWGFSGCVITNWGGSNDRVAALIAGNELEMPGTHGDSDTVIKEALARGIIEESLVDENVDRLLDLVYSTAAKAREPQFDFNIAQHHRISQRVAEESIVLLKNEKNILPLSHAVKVAVIGDFAFRPRYQGAGSSQVNPTILDTTLQSLEESGIRCIGFEEGFDRYGKPSVLKIKRACHLAARAETVLLYLGLDELSETQGIDRPHMRLPENQVQLLEALSEINPNIVVILSCGCAIEMPWIGKVRGLLHAYLGGQAVARAVLRIISGDVNPSGKLAETYPFRYEDTPAYYYYPGNGQTVEYREGPYIGYRYYDTAHKPVLFPFGFGLSYTQFHYSDIRVDSEGVHFTLTNRGRYAGMEVAQLYVGKPQSQIYRPLKELKGFTKVFINPGESKEVFIPFDDKTFRYFNTAAQVWDVEEGNYTIMVGSSSRDIHLTASYTVHRIERNLFLKKIGSQAEVGSPSPQYYVSSSMASFYFSGNIRQVPDTEFETVLGRPVPKPVDFRYKPFGYENTISQCRYARGWWGRCAFWIIHGTYRLLRFIGRRDLANLIMMFVYHLPFRGISRFTGGKISMAMVDGLLDMVNGHGFRGFLRFIRGWLKKINAQKSQKIN